VDLVSFLAQWNSSLFLNPIVNRDLILAGGFILWNFWKERNSMIFKEKKDYSRN